MRTRVRWMIARTCDRFIEWVDYIPDERWERVGPFIHPMYRLAEKFGSASLMFPK